MGSGAHAEDLAGTAAPIATRSAELHIPESPKHIEQHSFSLMYAAFAFVNLLFLALAEMWLPIEPYGDLSLIRFWFAAFVTVFAFAAAGVPILRRAVEALRSGSITVLSCAALALLLGALSDLYLYLTTSPALFEISLLHSSVSLILVIALQVKLDDFVRSVLARRIGYRVQRLLATTFKVVDESGNESRLPAEDLKPGLTVRLEAPESVPCDGVIVCGIGDIEERHLTGYTRKRVKCVGQRVFAGSRIKKGAVQVQVTSRLEDADATMFSSKLNGRVDAVWEESIVKRWMNLINGSVLFLAGIAGVYWYRAGVVPDEIIGAVTSVLLVTLLSRLAVFSVLVDQLSLSSAFRGGALPKSVDSLDRFGRLPRLALHYVLEDPPGQDSLTDFEMLDQRVERDGLLSALLALLSASQDRFFIGAIPYLRSMLSSPTLLEAREVVTYPDRGLVGVVESAEFSVGTEDFLIERGVQLQASEILVSDRENQVFYVAVGEEVLARFRRSRGLEAQGGGFVKDLERLGLRVELLSSAPQKVLDLIGKGIGLELVQISGDLTGDRLEKKLELLKPVGLYCSRETPLEAKQAAEVTLEVFDELLWEEPAVDLTLFTSDLGRLVALRRLTSIRRLLLRFALGAGGLIAAVLLGTALAGFGLPLIVATSVLLASVGLYLTLLPLAFPYDPRS